MLLRFRFSSPGCHSRLFSHFSFSGRQPRRFFDALMSGAMMTPFRRFFAAFFLDIDFSSPLSLRLPPIDACPPSIFNIDAADIRADKAPAPFHAAAFSLPPVFADARR